MRIDVEDLIVDQAGAKFHNVLSRKRGVLDRGVKTTLRFKIYFA